MPDSIFNLLRLDGINKHVRVTTTRKVFEGILKRCDEEGNLSVDTDDSLVLIQRKFLCSIEILKEELVV